jgi:enoyl-CoA hydratase
VATITINRPEVLNTLTRQVLIELAEALVAARRDRVRAVVLTGAGDQAFSTGADVGELATMTKAQARAFAELGHATLRQLETLPVPVIAAVNGFALGGGCEVTLACDLRLASQRAIFALPEVGLGVSVGFGASQRLPRLVGVGRAKELAYTGRRINATRAEQIGLVNAVWPAEDLLARADALARQIARGAPGAVRATKRAIEAGQDLDLEAGLAVEMELFADCFETADQRGAMAAYVERHPAPEFPGR